MPVLVSELLSESDDRRPYMDDISDTIYNDILLKVNVYKKLLTGGEEGAFKAFYSLCIGAEESVNAFSHSEFNKWINCWINSLNDPSGQSPYPNWKFIKDFKPGSRDLGQAGGSSGYEKSGTDQALPPAGEIASAAASAASASASSVATTVGELGEYIGKRYKSWMTKDMQSDVQLLARAEQYLNFFKKALIGFGETINVDTLHRNLKLLCLNFGFDETTILDMFSLTDYNSRFAYSGTIESDNLNITKQGGGNRKKKRKQRYTKRKNSKRRNTKRKKTYKHKRKTKKSKK